MGQTLPGDSPLPPAPSHVGRGNLARDSYSIGGTIPAAVDVAVDIRNVMEAGQAV